MVTDHLCSIGWRCPQGSFVSLMTLYESNYIRLGWILPDLRALEGSHVSRIANDVPLYLDITEHSRYTTLLNLSHRFDSPAGEVAQPDMQLRIYHDARLAESYSCADLPAHGALRDLKTILGGELDRRWTRNMLLNKWLEYCAERGHRFSAQTRCDTITALKPL